MNPLDIAQIEREIETLLVNNPELSEDETLRADMIEGETDAKAVLSKIVCRLRDAEMMADAIAERIDLLTDRRSSFEKRVEAMRSFAFRIMHAAKLRSLPLPEATLSIRATPPSVIITDESLIPADFTKTKKTPDRIRIREALKAGQDVPGACLSDAGETLSVKVG